MPVTRFCSYERNPDTESLSIADIVEMSPPQKSERRRLMRQFGSMLDQMLRGELEQVTIVREADRETIF